MAANKGAIKNALKSGVIEFIKEITGVSIPIEIVRGYQEHIESQQLNALTDALNERINAIERAFDSPWYSSPEGQEFVKKTVASALNAEYADKIEFFANMLVNAKQDFEQMERLKFVELVRQLSKPALKILSLAVELSDTTVGLINTHQIHGNAVSKFNLDGLLVDSCIDELFALGVFSQHHSKAKAGYTAFTQRFVDFLKYPEKDV